MEWHLVPFPYKMIYKLCASPPPYLSNSSDIGKAREKRMETEAFDRHLLQQGDIKGGNLQNKLHLEGSHISPPSVSPTVERTERFSGSLTR